MRKKASSLEIITLFAVKIIMEALLAVSIIRLKLQKQNHSLVIQIAVQALKQM